MKVFEIKKINDLSPEMKAYMRKLADAAMDCGELSIADIFNAMANTLGRVVHLGKIPAEMALEAFAQVLEQQPINKALAKDDDGLLS